MAEKVEIEIPGIGLIEAKNAATEATLLEILDVLKGTQKDNNKNAKGQKTDANKGSQSPAGGGGGAGLDQFNQQAKGAGKGLNLLTNAGKAAGMGMNILGRGAGMAVGGISRLGGGAVMAAGAAFTLGKMAMSAATSMTDLIQELANVGDSTEKAAATLGHIPVVGGLLAGVFGAVASASENVVKSFQTAASVGATFGGSVQAMSAAAGGAGMTLDQFAGLISKNSESLMLLGGTTEEGAKQFSKLAKGIQQSDVGSELQRLGFSTEQINGGMARHIGMLAKTGALQGMTNQQLVASSGAYMKELDALAKITGVSREAKEQEQAKLMKDGKIRAALAGLDADQQRQMMSYITSFPAEQQGAIADMIATGNVTTEEAIKLQSLLPGVAEQTMQFGRTLQAGGRISQDQMNQAKNNSILEAKESVKRNKARGLYDTEANASFAAMADLAAQKVDGYSQAIGEQGKATEKANLAENLTKAKQRLAEFSNGFQMALANSGALDGLMDVFSSFASLIMSTVVPVFTNYIVPIITNFVVPALQAVFAIAGKIAAGLSMLLMPAIDAVSAAMGPGSGLSGTIEIVDGILNAVFPPLAAIVRGAIMAFEGLLEGVGFLIAPIKRLFGAFGELGDTGDWLTKTFLYIGDYIGESFRLLGFIIGGAIDVVTSVVRWFGDLVRSSETLTGAFKLVGSAIDLMRTYFSPEGFKAILASIKEFFQHGISDFFSSFKDAMMSMMGGMLQLIGKIPGFGSLAKSGKEMEQEVEDRKKARQEAATARQGEINQLHKAAVDHKEQRDQKIQGHQAAVKQDARAFADKKIHLQNTRGLNQEEEDEKKKKLDEAKGVTVDMSDPIQMLKSFAAKNKSAYTQEAKALDAKEKTQSELNMSSQELSKAQIELNKAGNDLEKKTAEEKVKAASERVKKAAKADEESEETIRKAAERMKLAKQGKDPGAVAEGKAKDDKKTETGKGPEAPGKTPEAPGKPASSSGPQEGLKTDAAMAKYLQTIALIESNGDKNAKAGTSSASGMFQFTEGTWKDMVKQMGKSYKSEDRFDPAKATEVAAFFSQKQKAQIEKSTGREAGQTDLYMAHFLGAGGASKFLKAKDKDPTQSAAALDKDAAKANKNIYYTKEGKERSVQEVYDLMDKKVKAKSELVEKGKVNADVAAIGGGSYKPGTKVDAVAEGKPKPQDTKTETKPDAAVVKAQADAAEAKAAEAKAAKARADFAANDPRRAAMAVDVKPVEAKPVVPGKVPVQESLSPGEQVVPNKEPVKPAEVKKEEPAKLVAPAEVKKEEPAKLVAPAEVKKEEPAKLVAPAEVKKEETTVGTLQGLMRDGVIPTTMAFQDLVSKGIKPFQSMLNGVQIKPVEVKTAEAQAKLKTGDLPEVAKTMADAQAKIVQSAQESNKTRGMYDKDTASAYAGASDQAKAVQASMTEGAKFMFSGFDNFATDLSSGMTKTFSFVGTDLSSTFSDKLRGTMDDGLGLFTTDLANNFSAFESLDLPSMVSGLDDYTKQIYAASDEIAKGEAAIAQQEAAITSASANLQDPAVSNKDEIVAAVAAMKDNIQLQKATIGFNKDVIDKNIMARAETPLTELIAQANKDAQEKIRLAEEAATEKEKQAADTMMAGNSQEGALSGSSDLNTALAELIAIGKRTADLNEKQLSVQNSLSGDLFA